MERIDSCEVEEVEGEIAEWNSRQSCKIDVIHIAKDFRLAEALVGC